eukprot:5431983-Karenia_brevis.AAC.1
MLRDFSVEAQSPVGATSIASARNAFCSLVVRFNRQALQPKVALATMSVSPGCPLRVYVRYVRDEAVFRMRPVLQSNPSPSA